jgi:membrane protein DedA with SNARE-associated domain
MQELLYLVATYGLLVVFVSVLIDQGGIPIPAYPALVVTSALAVDRGATVWPIVGVSVAAALLADLAWFAGGRRFGNRLLQLMCRISLSPDSCVLTTRGIFARWCAHSWSRSSCRASPRWPPCSPASRAWPCRPS